MNYKSYITAAMLGAALIAAPSCQDEFAETNTNPSAVTKADVRYLFTKALAEFEPSKYQQWFYNNTLYTLPWVQATLSEDGGNKPAMNIMSAFEGGERQVITVKLYTEEINYVLSQMTEEEAARYENIRVMCNPLLVYLGIFGTDMYGSMAYSEAAKGLHEELLTPKYETQEELFDVWLDQLNETIEVLGANLPDQVKLDAQDFVYNGDANKWMKFANSLKLKLAVRLMHVNPAKAKAIAEEAANNPAGLMNSLDDDFFYCKGAQEYHWGDDVFNNGRGVGSDKLISFLVNHEDPRVRFIFQKNDFNSKVVQAFLDHGVELPSYIKEVAIIKNGKFEGWSGKGEPWVRYFGAPVNTSAYLDGTLNAAYFNYDKFKIGSKQYYPLARMNQEMLQGQKDYTFPDAPEVSASQDIVDNAWYGLHFSSAEVNLYLAELSVALNANLPGSAAEYLQQGIKLSVQEYDELAKRNKIPYYDKAYVSIPESPALSESTLQLKDGEIDNLLAEADYQLSGTKREQLEKIYIQQYIHFLLFPQEQFVQVRRSGVPMRGSKLLPWVDFTSNGDVNFSIPRRWMINTPLESDLMYQIKVDAFKAQGYTTGTQDPTTLNTERVWYDQGAPNFGEGPNF